MDPLTLIMWFFLLAGVILLALRTFFFYALPRPDLLAGGLLCWLIAYMLERVG